MPGATVSSPYPCASFRELYVAHDPRWFLPKYKLWFSGRDLTGKLIIVRYDQRSGCIEGYQMLAISNRTTFQFWPADDHVVIHAFEPEVKLHLDKPVLQLRACPPENLEPVEMRGQSPVTLSISPPGSPGQKRRRREDQPSRFAAEIAMDLNGTTADTMFNNFMLTRPAVGDASKHSQRFPYGNIWPPPAVPARHRVYADSFDPGGARRPDRERPAKRAEVSDQAFHIRTWMEMRLVPLSFLLPHLRPPPSTSQVNAGDSQEEDENESEEGGTNSLHSQASRPWPYNLGPSAALRIGHHIGEEITTYALSILNCIPQQRTSHGVGSGSGTTAGMDANSCISTNQMTSPWMNRP